MFFNLRNPPMSGDTVKYFLATILLAFVGVHAGTAQETTKHPLDPLTAQEIETVRTVLEEEGKVDPERIENHEEAFGMVYLNPPEKQRVLDWQQGDELGREAFASVYDHVNDTIYEAVVDLDEEELVSYETVPGKQPVGTFERDSIMTEIAKNDPRVQKALENRDIPIDSVEFGGNHAADMSLNDEGNREIIASAGYKDSHVSIRGLYAHIDVSDREVLKVTSKEGEYSEDPNVPYFDADSLKSTLPQMKPVIIDQPNGTNYKIEGKLVETPHWKFRYGIHNREGLVIYDVRYYDPYQEEWRDIMYRGSNAEMVVSYNSPTKPEASNNYFDQGEFRFFQEKNRPLNAGADAPENATYIDAVVHDDMGNPVKIDSAVAVYEKYNGALWRHGKTGRRATSLAIKYYIKAGNYDYGFEWVFKEDGGIKVNNELQGIAHINTVDRTDDRSFPDDEHYQGDPYGITVHPHVQANNHQHWHVWRLDMDVDGPKNTVVEKNNIAVPAGPQNPYGNAVVADTKVLETEQEAQRKQHAPSSRRWRVVNTNTESGEYGHPPAYQLHPKKGTVPLAHKGSSISNRARVLYNHLWVTPYNRDQMYPAGMYPASDQKFAGLPKWTADNQNIKDEDVVLWYVMGKSHIVKPEDWPIMNHVGMSFQLKPWGFFKQNPAWGKPPVHDRILESMKDVKQMPSSEEE
jgi:primary-amine oxidase